MLRLLAAAAAAAAGAVQLGEEEVKAAWTGFKAKHGRSYGPEEQRRLGVFRQNLELVLQHNAKEGRTFDMAINQFSDLSDEEFSRQVLMDKQDCSATGRKGLRAPAAAPDLPSRWDWREKGVIGEVKSQGHCGSCWTFSATGCLEAHAAIKYDSWHAPRLSEQQLVDCAQAFDNHGCAGGLPSHAFEYVRAAGGLSTEFHYPYFAKDGKCSFNASAASPFEPASAGIGAQVPGGSVNLTVGDEQSLKYFLATHGPVSVAFQVASDFRHYSNGVYSSTVCKNGPQDVNHAVLAVGYGTDPASGKAYWLIKNSWDYSWGDEGFFRIEAFQNMCGVADCMAFPDLYGLNAAAAAKEAAEASDRGSAIVV